MPLAVFAVAALGLVAFGRVDVASAQVLSRYMVLGGLAWSLAAFMALERLSDRRRPFRLLAWCLPALGLFNVAANARFLNDAETFVEARERAASRYKQHREDGRGLFRLHPLPGRADELLTQAAQRGIYELPRFCFAQHIPVTEPSTRLVSHIDEITANQHAAFLDGWAVIPGRISRRGEIHVVLRNEHAFHVFNTLTIRRPDVASAHAVPGFRLSGFRFVMSRARLPVGEFEIGLLIRHGDHGEYVMTGRRLDLREPAPPQLAKGG